MLSSRAADHRMNGHGGRHEPDTAFKLLFSGPVGAGKTTAIGTLSDIAPVRTDAVATDATSRLKRETTVAMDFGVLRLSATEQLHLYGTPGQERFDFMWEILQEGALGLVLMIDHRDPGRLDQLAFFVDAYRAFIADTALAVGVTHTDEAPFAGVDAYADRLAADGLTAPVYAVDARERRDVARLVEALLFTIDSGLTVGATGAGV